MAGPVIACAIQIPCSHKLELKDSKALSASRREQFSSILKNKGYGYAFGVVGSEEIDEINILKASLKAMNLALAGLKSLSETILIDGNRLPQLIEIDKKVLQKINIQAVIKGDKKHREIQAAAILAKVYRDDLMSYLGQKYSNFSFDKHKGYPTQSHLHELAKYGVIEGVHRKSFAPVKKHLG